MERRWRLLALLVLCGGLAFTTAVVGILAATTAARDRTAFEANARLAQNAVLERVETLIALLRGTAGLFASQEGRVSVQEFRAYLNRVGLREQYPGLLGIGFSLRVPAGEHETLVQRMRDEGHAGFRLWPSEHRDEWHSIVLLEPIDDRNSSAIGYDMFTHPVRRAAMERARDRGRAAASEIVELVQEIDTHKQPGFLIYLPVYRGGATPARIDERRQALLGFAYAPIRAGDFLASAFTAGSLRIGLRVHHGREPHATLLFEHGSADLPTNARFDLLTTVDVAGQPWTFEFRSFDTVAESLVVPALVAAAGIAISFALATLLWREGRTRGAIQAALEREHAARTQAERANRMKDDFLAKLSHELRTPLSAIVGWASVVRMRGFASDDVPAAINAVERNATALARLIDDLLDMNRIVSGKLHIQLVSLDPAPVLRDAIAAVQPSAQQKGVRIVTEASGPALRVRADPARLQQILWNLLTNAIKFTPAGGQVTARLERFDTSACLTVRDTGEGIDPEFLAQVFERFTQADSTITRRHGGLGIGLAIVRELVALHHGEVRAHSAGRGKGAMFQVLLPIADTGSVDSSRPTTQLAGALAGISVLVVDDDPALLQFVGLMLEQRRAQVYCAGSAAEALEALERYAPDVLVSDIGMPETDGYELMRRIRALPPQRGGAVAAVALTAYARPEDARDALAAGFQRHLTKPVDPEALTAAVLALAAQARRDGDPLEPGARPVQINSRA